MGNHADIVGDKPPGNSLDKRQGKDEPVAPFACLAYVHKENEQAPRYGRPEMPVEVSGQPADEYRGYDDPGDRRQEQN